MKSFSVRNYFFPTAEIESAVASLTFFMHSLFTYIFVDKYLQGNLIDRDLLSDCALWAQIFLWFKILPKIKSIILKYVQD